MITFLSIRMPKVYGNSTSLRTAFFMATRKIILGDGEQGPCGPCSEIHIDLRPDEEVKKKPGKDLVNNDHPQWWRSGIGVHGI